mgnify:CR=1 FL=1|jgi:hypothetical protein
MFKLKVTKPFRDKNNPEKNYKEGETLTTDEISRVNDLVARGMCVISSVEVKTANEDKNPGGEGSKIMVLEKEFEVEAVKKALDAIGVGIAKNAGVPGVTKKLSELTEEQTKALFDTLCADPK